MNRGSACEETEVDSHSRTNCCRRGESTGQRQRDRDAVLLTRAASSLWGGGRRVGRDAEGSSPPCHLYSNCPLVCHSDYSRRGHANEEAEKLAA